MTRSSAQIRAEIADALALDLVGPTPGHALAGEILPEPPSRWYLTGFLVPYEASDEQKSDPTSQEQIAVAGEGGGTDDETEPEQPSARKLRFPSSIGVSVLVPEASKSLLVRVTWGDYKPQTPSGEHALGDAAAPRREMWRRTPRGVELRVELKKRRQTLDVEEGGGGLRLVVTWRAVGARAHRLVEPGTRAVSLFVVNDRTPTVDARKDEAFAFQAALAVSCEGGFCPRPNVRGRDARDWDEQVADVQYRNIMEFAVGHGVATSAQVGAHGICERVETVWVPHAQVEKVVPGEAPGVELSMEALAAAPTPADLAGQLRPLVDGYAAWIAAQRPDDLKHPSREEVTRGLLARARAVQKRIGDGIDVLERGGPAFEAFRLANRAMARQARRRLGDFNGKGTSPRWRPFQLAFVLLNVRGIVEPTHADRETVDLLFFPTGGGKTEAYLGLAAFTLVLRRLRNPGVASAGVAVLMRYTLRLLTLDQLGRAATLICALELERQQDVERLGPWPFEVGLWVGQAATPNRIGKKGDNDRFSARARTIAFQNDDRKPSPIPIETCPWCGTKFKKDSFVLVAGGKENADRPTDLRVRCLNRDCDFAAARGHRLPVIAVDEPIYCRLPCFLIATVDKFASLPWVGETGALLGRVERHDAEGFYGAADPHLGKPLDKPLLPPELVIQDELHLISGPLGTMVGLYETVIDELSTRADGVRPKVVASTATVRRAETQIHALFARPEVDVFPPPGPDVRDSFFARTVRATDPEAPSASTRNARLYVGIAAPGRSPKVALLRSYLALMSAAERAYETEGGARVQSNAADPYMTTLGYFNSLRELGGSRRIVEDEVRSKLSDFGRLRRRVGDSGNAFSDRHIAYEVVELTSRENTSKVANTKRRLELAFANKDERVDVALATNMISVGLDITRLGLMVVLGQPKTTAEYIQATSRVGRDDERPGLVVTLLNVHRPRDRSHYERFEAFHASFYRSVEATSVTPFARRAVDRGIAGVTVALARHGKQALTPAIGAATIGAVRAQLGAGEVLARRVAAHDPHEPPSGVKEDQQRLRARVDDILDAWVSIAADQGAVGAGLQYQSEVGGPPALLHDPLDPELVKLPAIWHKFKSQRSLRDVEPNVNLWVRTLDGADVEIEEEER